jgi:hypothetical protein
MTDEGRPTWLYTTQWITDGVIGPIVGMEIIELRSLQFGPPSYGPGFGVWVSIERVESDLALVNWLLGWYPAKLKHELGRVEITRHADHPVTPIAQPAESPAE